MLIMRTERSPGKADRKTLYKHRFSLVKMPSATPMSMGRDSRALEDFLDDWPDFFNICQMRQRGFTVGRYACHHYRRHQRRNVMNGFKGSTPAFKWDFFDAFQLGQNSGEGWNHSRHQTIHLLLSHR